VMNKCAELSHVAGRHCSDVAFFLATAYAFYHEFCRGTQAKVVQPVNLKWPRKTCQAVSGLDVLNVWPRSKVPHSRHLSSSRGS
jgi:hypothetical protein